MHIPLQHLMAPLVPSPSLLSIFVHTTLWQLTVELVMITVMKSLRPWCVFLHLNVGMFVQEAQ